MDIFRLVGHDILVGLINVMIVFRYYFCAGIISANSPRVTALVDHYEIYIYLNLTLLLLIQEIHGYNQLG